MNCPHCTTTNAREGAKKTKRGYAMKTLPHCQVTILIFSTVLMKGALRPSQVEFPRISFRYLSYKNASLSMKREGRQWERDDA